MICFNAPLTNSGFYSFDSDLGPLSLFIVFPPPLAGCFVQWSLPGFQKQTHVLNIPQNVCGGRRVERSALSLSLMTHAEPNIKLRKCKKNKK